MVGARGGRISSAQSVKKGRLTISNRSVTKLVTRWFHLCASKAVQRPGQQRLSPSPPPPPRPHHSLLGHHRARRLPAPAGGAGSSRAIPCCQSSHSPHRTLRLRDVSGRPPNS